jgi:hypothetical protein
MSLAAHPSIGQFVTPEAHSWVIQSSAGVSGNKENECGLETLGFEQPGAVNEVRGTIGLGVYIDSAALSLPCLRCPFSPKMQTCCKATMNSYASPSRMSRQFCRFKNVSRPIASSVPKSSAPTSICMTEAQATVSRPQHNQPSFEGGNTKSQNTKILITEPLSP